MIHSMSGGVIKKYATKTLVKVRLDESTVWYECVLPVFVGDSVIVEFEGREETGKVEEVKTQVTADNSPVPFPLLREVIGIAEEEL